MLRYVMLCHVMHVLKGLWSVENGEEIRRNRSWSSKWMKRRMIKEMIRRERGQIK